MTIKDAILAEEKKISDGLSAVDQAKGRLMQLENAARRPGLDESSEVPETLVLAAVSAVLTSKKK